MPDRFSLTLTKQLLRFLTVGLANSLFGLVLIFAAMYWGGLSKELANGLGYAGALILSYLLNKSFTFAHRGAYLTTAWRFGLVIVLAYLANLATVILAAEQLGVNAYLAQVLGIPPYTLVTFFGCRAYVFKRG
ncbi:MAG TPA: GtrA family protein [Motiliproteus sp.]